MQGSILNLGMRIALVLSFTLVGVYSRPPSPPFSVENGPACTSLTIGFNTTATNYNVIVDGSLENGTFINQLLATAPNVTKNAPNSTVSGYFNISARYCEPEVKMPQRAQSIQFLVHGATYTKDYWSALGFPGFEPDTYSWIAFASKQGWPTLSVDRLGVGQSSHPDPVHAVQFGLETEVLANIILALKSGVIGGRPFKNIIYVGHSYGSELGNHLAASHPDAIDALILTGFSSTRANISIEFSAANSEFVRLEDLASGYLVLPTAGQRSVFYGANGTFDPRLLDIDTDTQQTATVGEFISRKLPPPVANGFTAPVFIMTGDQDQPFCPGGHCDSGVNSSLAPTGQLFPKSRSFSFYVPQDTGHDINIHYSAPVSFARAHSWMQEQGF
ncbi:hypothetical protein CLAIMM_00086 [Cladophialophora immunda]|nr:hypothetical protein CLAIMM_00086 [Cladophialophora immunda]